MEHTGTSGGTTHIITANPPDVMRQPPIRALLAVAGIVAAATIRAVHSMDSTATLILVLTGLAILLAIAAVIHRRASGHRQ